MTDLELRPPAPARKPLPPTGPLRPLSPRRTPWQRVHAAVLRLDAATPAGRDRAADVLRALAITGVVLGHWLVSGVVLQAGGHLVGDSPLGHRPGLAPVTWLLQPLAVFFLVGGRVSARSYEAALARGTGYRTWLRQRLRSLLRPATAFALTWGLVWLGLVLAGTAHETIHTLMWLAYSPSGSSASTRCCSRQLRWCTGPEPASRWRPASSWPCWTARAWCSRTVAGSTPSVC